MPLARPAGGQVIRSGRFGNVVLNSAPILAPNSPNSKLSQDQNPPELQELLDADLLRTNKEDKTTFGLLIHGQVVKGISPGSYPDIALKDKPHQILPGDVLVSVNGAAVTGETALTHIKETRDAVGTKMKIVLERKGKQMDIELIRQTTFRIAQCDKVMKALGNLAPRCAADEAYRFLAKEVHALLTSVAQDEAANAERIYALQLWAREYFREEKEKFSAKDADWTRMRRDLREANLEISRLKETNIANVEKLNSHSNEALSLKNEILSLQKQLGDKLMADEALKYQVSSLRDEISSLQKQIRDATQANESLKEQAKSDSLQLAKAMDLSKVMDQALEESNKARLDLERELEAAKKTIGDLQTQLDEAKASVSAPPSQNHPVSTRDETTLSYPTKDDSSSQNSASASPSASASASISDPPPNPVEQNEDEVAGQKTPKKKKKSKK